MWLRTLQWSCDAFRCEGRCIVFDQTSFMLQPMVHDTWAPACTSLSTPEDRHERLAMSGALTVPPMPGSLHLSCTSPIFEIPFISLTHMAPRMSWR